MSIYRVDHAEFEFLNDSIELYDQNTVYINFSKKKQKSIFQKNQKTLFQKIQKSICLGVKYCAEYENRG